MLTLKAAGYVNAVFCSVIMLASSGLVATAYGLRDRSIKYDVFLYYYSTLTSLTVIITASADFCMGLLGFFASILCIRHLLIVYANLICIVCLMKTLIASTCFFLKVHEIWSVEQNFMNHFMNSSLIFDTQRELKCCGIKAASDWRLMIDSCIPESCFKLGQYNGTKLYCENEMNLSDIYLHGCVHELEMLAPQSYLLTITNLFVMLQTVQVISFLMAFYLQVRLRSRSGFSKLKKTTLNMSESSVDETGLT